MTQIKKLAVGIVFVALSYYAAGTPALASDGLTCNLSSDKFDELAAIQNDYSLDYTQKIKEELQIRKELLADTVNCAIQEANDLKNNLNSTATDDPTINNLKNKLSDQLANAINYYELQGSQIGDLGLQGSQDFAKNLKDWRNGNYKQAAQLASNLMLWINDQPIMQVAQDRINQIGKTVSLLKIVDNDEIQSLWNDAQANFKSAMDTNQRAIDDLKSFGSPDESLGEIKSSLESLSNMYKKFFDLVNALKGSPPS